MQKLSDYKPTGYDLDENAILHSRATGDLSPTCMVDGAMLARAMKRYKDLHFLALQLQREANDAPGPPPTPELPGERIYESARKKMIARGAKAEHWPDFAAAGRVVQLGYAMLETLPDAESKIEQVVALRGPYL